MYLFGGFILLVVAYYCLAIIGCLTGGFVWIDVFVWWFVLLVVAYYCLFIIGCLTGGFVWIDVFVWWFILLVVAYYCLVIIGCLTGGLFGLMDLFGGVYSIGGCMLLFGHYWLFDWWFCLD